MFFFSLLLMSQQYRVDVRVSQWRTRFSPMYIDDDDGTHTRLATSWTEDAIRFLPPADVKDRADLPQQQDTTRRTGQRRRSARMGRYRREDATALILMWPICTDFPPAVVR